MNQTENKELIELARTLPISLNDLEPAYKYLLNDKNTDNNQIISILKKCCNISIQRNSDLLQTVVYCNKNSLVVKATKQMERVKFSFKDFAKGAAKVAQVGFSLKKFSKAIKRAAKHSNNNPPDHKQGQNEDNS